MGSTDHSRPTEPDGPGLPYGPWLQKALAPLRRVFRVFNRWMTLPIYRAGLGPLMSSPLTVQCLALLVVIWV